MEMGIANFRMTENAVKYEQIVSHTVDLPLWIIDVYDTE